MRHITLLMCAFTITVFAQAQVPPFSWAKTFINGPGQGNSVCTDSDGNSYTTGTFNAETDFDPSLSGQFMLASSGEDAFVLKLDAAGNFVWAIKFGGSGEDRGEDITLDSNGDLVITGSFERTVDFDPGAGTFSVSSAEDSKDIFIVKLDADGNFIWAKTLGDTFGDGGNSVATDPTGNIYVAGYFSLTVDFDPNGGSFQVTADGGEDGFLLKLDSEGDFLWVDDFGNSYEDRARAVVVASNGEPCLTGSIGFDDGNIRYTDIYIARYTSDGDEIWDHRIGDQTDESFNHGIGISTDEDGGVYVTGDFYNSMDFDPGAGTFILQKNAVSSQKGYYILKLDDDGNFNWANNSSVYSAVGNSVSVDGDGGVFVTGAADVTESSYKVFVSKFENDGDQVFFETFGNTSAGSGNTIYITQAGNIYVTGNYSGTADFNIGTDKFEVTSVGTNIFLLSLNGTTGEPSTGEPEVFNAISADGDDTNKVLYINNIELFENTHVAVFSRWGDQVWESENYNNTTHAFSGQTKNGNDLPSGIYFYKITFADGKKLNGFLSLKR